MGVKVGVYTNLNNWKEIVGLDFSGLSKYPLWYAHYDGKEVSRQDVGVPQDALKI